MDESAKVVTRGLVDMLIGTVLVAGALVALCFPVYLDTHDRYGMPIKCGNGYYSQLLQAAVDDQEQAQQSAIATNYVDQCKSALVHRRAWVLPVAAVGALILVSELVAWSRGGSPNSSRPTSAAPPPEDTDLKTAELLDRKYRSHRSRPSNTTL